MGSSLTFWPKENSTWRARICHMKGRELNRRLLQHRGIGDRVAAIDGFRLVAGHPHRRAARHAGALQIADRRATKVVDQPAGHTRVSAGRTPSPAKVLDTAAIRL